jgi:hypothetical protein
MRLNNARSDQLASPPYFDVAEVACTRYAV